MGSKLCLKLDVYIFGVFSRVVAGGIVGLGFLVLRLCFFLEK